MKRFFYGSLISFGLTSSLLSASTNQDSDLQNTHKPPYTASEAHLSLLLEDKYTPVDPVLPEPALRQNVLTALHKAREILEQNRILSMTWQTSEDPLPPVRKFDEDSFFVDELTRALMHERAFDLEWVVLYRGVCGDEAYLNDLAKVYEELQVRIGENVQPFGVHCPNLADIHTGDAFLKEKEKSQDSGRPFSAYPIYINFFLFGRFDSAGSCSVDFFEGGSHNSPQFLEAYLHKKILEETGVSLDLKKYAEAYKSVMGTGPELHHRLYQMFVHPDHVNTLSSINGWGQYSQFNYALAKEKLGKNLSTFPTIQSGQTPVIQNGETVPNSLMPTSRFPKEFVQLIRNYPELTKNVMSESASQSEFCTSNPDYVEGIVIPKTELLNNPEIIQTFSYHRTLTSKDRYALWMQTLKAMMAKDLGTPPIR